MRIVVGLGNPGREYARTRHNAGFWVLDRLAAKWHTALDQARFSGLAGQWAGKDVGGNEQQVLLLKPMTYMNLSGQAVSPAVRWHKADPAGDLLVVSDDMDLPVGTLRMRAGGSSGGQKGLASIAALLGTQDFARLRVGIGRPPRPGPSGADYVLQPPSAGEQAAMDDAVERAVKAVECWVAFGIQRAMNEVN